MTECRLIDDIIFDEAEWTCRTKLTLQIESKNAILMMIVSGWGVDFSMDV